jgi:hypothetical protein
LARGQRRQQRSPSIGAGSYHNQTTEEPFSRAVLGDVMLSVVLRLQACQERHIDLLEVVRANPGDAGLRAQFNEAVPDLVVVVAKMRALEAEWGFVAPAPPPAVP